MNKMTWKDLAEGLGILAIVASLIFVGLELQQSRAIAIADIHQQKAAMAIQVQQGTINLEVYTPALRKLFNGEPLEDFEIGALKFAQNPWFQYWENTYFQYQMGLLSESAWLASRNSMRDRLRRPIYQEWWADNRDEWRSDFAKEVDEVLAEALSEI